MDDRQAERTMEERFGKDKVIGMKEKAFPVSMVLLWGIVFTQAMNSVTLGICMGLLMGIAFGLFDSGKGGKDDE